MLPHHTQSGEAHYYLDLFAAIPLVAVDRAFGAGWLVLAEPAEGRQTVSAATPAALTIVKDYGEPRYPSFMGIRKASKANIPTWSLADLGIAAPAAVISWPALMNPPSREVTCEVIAGANPDEIAEKLADKILAEKVL